ncbi:substrate-binding domain-containing protein [uncultured Bacteroides sp.]|uniref:hybrid sensor histidine kinase/response regulator transcription factor n=1 Tax=uncultured Bacteroides sp. TaxID=162156 RepID=UPI0025D92751|nr:substrate-binding domain-containing protein [uncultured Bacteroides sp.]
MKQAHSWILFFLCLLCAGLASCIRNTPRYHIGISQCSDDEWRRQMNSEIIREARFYDDVQVEIRTAKDDNVQQEADIRHFINEGVDLLVVAPNEAQSITPIVEEAYNKGIPVILVDRKISSDRYTAYIGADNHAIGREVAAYIGNLLQGNGSVVEITGLAGSTPAIERHEGFLKGMAAYPGIRLLATSEGAWLRRQASEKMEALLDSFPHIDVVFAQNDRMASGAYEAALRKQRARQMSFVGIDALSGEHYGLEDILAGRLTASFIYPTGGDRVVQIAMDILQGKTFPRETILGTSVVDSTNAPVMKMQTAHISTLDGKIELLNGEINRSLVRYATQQTILYGSLAALLLLVGMLVAVYLSLRAKNRMNRELSLQKEQLIEQKELLIEQKDLLIEQKSQLETQKSQLEQLSHELEEATHAKLVFFTNISHDFRTPLTLIADPIEQLLANPVFDGQPRQLLLLMKKNVHILLRLVNQILDFRKVENGRMELRLEPFDLLDSFRNWNDSFCMALLKKHITFSFEAPSDMDFRMQADAEKMECIYFNLFSNALKYTPENGKITICLAVVAENYVLSVFNSGSYISSADVEAIFQRFYQVSGHQAGTGIGLALVHAFVEMHGGSITAGSDEKGTTFTVVFPKCETSSVSFVAAVRPFEKSMKLQDEEQEASSMLVDAEVTADEEEVTTSETEVAVDCPTVLVIDDNADIRNYVKSLLAGEYRVLDAADGSAGIRLAMKNVPDVIVSDVMMPGMDGVECCRRLKGELQTCHIPVILLTACSLDEQRIQGYDGGADSYISKPFSSQLLLSRVRNLITNRRQLKQFFGDNQGIEKEVISDMDKDFVYRFRTLVEEKMKDAELNVEDLGRDMGMSRVQLYRKLKSLTNYSPNELLRQIRLKKAASLLASADMTVAEIAYEVGFSSPSYFTKCYKEQFGESPTEFLKRRG